jgi:hypothetical protein
MILFHHRAVEARFAKTGCRGLNLRPFAQGYKQQKEAVNGRMKNHHVKMERFNSFSDGIFAVLITILVLDLRPPTSPTLNALLSHWPSWLSYAVSYLFVAIVWVSRGGHSELGGCFSTIVLFQKKAGVAVLGLLS